jgi:hypothetical protein
VNACTFVDVPELELTVSSTQEHLVHVSRHRDHRSDSEVHLKLAVRVQRGTQGIHLARKVRQLPNQRLRVRNGDQKRITKVAQSVNRGSVTLELRQLYHLVENKDLSINGDDTEFAYTEDCADHSAKRATEVLQVKVIAIVNMER